MADNYTAEDLAILQAAIASGEFSVKHNGRAVTYRSLAEMQAIESRMIRSIAASSQAYKKTYRINVESGL